jgi:hypothetical protein
MLYRVHLAWAGFEFTTLMVIGTDYISSCKLITMYDHDHDGPCIIYKIHHWYIQLYSSFLYITIRAGVIHVLDEDILMMWYILSCWMRTCWWCDAYCRDGWGHVDDVMHIVVLDEDMLMMWCILSCHYTFICVHTLKLRCNQVQLSCRESLNKRYNCIMLLMIYEWFGGKIVYRKDLVKFFPIITEITKKTHCQNSSKI